MRVNKNLRQYQSKLPTTFNTETIRYKYWMWHTVLRKDNVIRSAFLFDYYNVSTIYTLSNFLNMVIFLASFMVSGRLLYMFMPSYSMFFFP